MSSMSLDRLLTYAEDTLHTTGDEGSFVLAVQQNTLAASAGDGDYAAFKVNSKGELYTHDTDANTSLTAIAAAYHAEDSVHTSGDSGVMPLAVRNDAGSALAADGDYIPLTTDNLGRLRVAGSFTPASPNTAIASAAFTVGTTEVALPTTALSGREEVIIQNRGPQPIYIGPTGVTTSTGLEIGKRSNVTLALGPSVDVYGISTVAGNNVRVFEIS